MHPESVLNFKSYRDYLRHYYETRKNHDRTYSFRQFSEEAGLRSPNYLKLVMDGKKNLTNKNIHQFAAALKLSLHELEYFEALVLFEQATIELERLYYRQRLAHFIGQKDVSKVYLSDKSSILRWYFPAVLLCMDGLKESNAAAIISKKLGVPLIEIQICIQTLLESKAIVPTEGKYVLSKTYLYLHDTFSSHPVQKNYVKEQLLKSQEAFQRGYGKTGKFYCHTMKINSDDRQIYIDKYKKFLDEITAFSDQSQGDEIFQINTQMFELQ